MRQKGPTILSGICEKCKKIYYYKKGKNKNRRYCSKSCATKVTSVGRICTTEKRKKLSELLVNNKSRMEHIRLLGKQLVGDKNNKWKGENVGYRGIHYWVSNHSIKPKFCTFCGETKNRMGWANIDHKYRRVLEDYIFLCPKCHGEYDKNNNLRKRKC